MIQNSGQRFEYSKLQLLLIDVCDHGLFLSDAKTAERKEFRVWI